MSEIFSTAHRFFAAANGTTGFRSYFDEIFPSESLSGVFILKGGPGTGKSTLLKELSTFFLCPEIQQEIFHCSSDPRSLDGLLLSREKRRVAILDGTAPHERDARVPGATDVLVNLGDGFDLSALRGRREEILSLQKKKSISYKDAYFYLGIFGIFESKILAETKDRLKKSAVALLAEDGFFEKSEVGTSAFSPRLIGAFCRDGMQRLNTYEAMASRHLQIIGTDEECKILLSSLFSCLSRKGHAGYFSPSPFFHDWIDGLFLKDISLSVTEAKTEGARALFAKDFFEERSDDARKRIEEYRTESARYLALAKEALSRASESHFALEEIYTPAMHFERIAPLKAALKKEISALLGTREFS